MADYLDLWFKAAVYGRDGQYSSVIPSAGTLPVYKFSVKGGDKRAFLDEQVTDNYMDLGSELEQMKKYRNIEIVRESDLYSVEFLEAKIKRAKLTVGMLFSIRSGVTTKARTLMSSYAKMREFDHLTVGGKRYDYMLLKLSAIEITFKHEHEMSFREGTEDPNELGGE